MDEVHKKNQENGKIGAAPYSESVRSAGIYHYCHGILISSSTNRTQSEATPCKVDIWKGEDEDSLRRQHAELKSRRNNELEGENESWKKCKKFLKSPGIL